MSAVVRAQLGLVHTSSDYDQEQPGDDREDLVCKEVGVRELGAFRKGIVWFISASSLSTAHTHPTVFDGHLGAVP